MRPARSARLWPLIRRGRGHVRCLCGGPAARAGIDPGDLLLSVGGQPVTGVDALLRWLTGEGVRAAAQVERLRRGDLRRVTVVPAERD